jgi:HEAT repeat protein
MDSQKQQALRDILALRHTGGALLARDQLALVLEGAQSRDRFLRAECIRALQGCSDPAAIPVLVQAINDWYQPVVEAAIRAIAASKNASAIRPLYDFVRNGNPKLLRPCLAAIETLKKEAA